MTDHVRIAGEAAAVRALRDDRVEEAAAMMARAFFDYPMWTWILPDETHRREALLVSARASVLWGRILGHTFVIGEPLSGLAIWAPPGMADADVDPDGSRTHWDDVVRAIGPDGMRKFEAMIEVQRPLREKHIPAGGWYLPWLGVEPAAQRTGSGTALLRDMFARLDAEGVATYLETEKAANVPYYLKHGYALAHEGELPDGGPAFWSMRREPTS
ncbi:MAG: GNAT family N-acetyltransferase [Chloroflexi bacterium]|nr:GNAT family N-acetyltransferase [Chloroflexota bacterium]